MNATWPWALAFFCAVAGAGWILSGHAIKRCVTNEEQSLAHVPGDDFPEDDWCAQ